MIELPTALTTVDLVRLRFAATSIHHFLFVPLTRGWRHPSPCCTNGLSDARRVVGHSVRSEAH